MICLNLFHWIIMENIFRTTKAKTAGSMQDNDVKEEFTIKSSNSSKYIISSIIVVYGGGIISRLYNFQILSISSYNISNIILLDSRDSMFYIMMISLPILLTIFASCLRAYSMYTLGCYFSRRLAIRGYNHSIINTGPYAYVRHPGYSANMILLGCYSFVVSGDLIIGLLLYIQYLYILLKYRISMEEEMFLNNNEDTTNTNTNTNININSNTNINANGNSKTKRDYVAYQKKVPWKLIPFVI